MPGRPSKIDHDRAVELHQSGLSLKAVGRELGCSADLVRYVLRKRGIATQPYVRPAMRQADVRKSCSFRLSPTATSQLEELRGWTGGSYTNVIEQAIRLLHARSARDFGAKKGKA